MARAGERETALEVARIDQQLAHEGDGVAVHRVERNGPLGCDPKRLPLPLKVEHLSQTEMRQVIRWPDLYRAPCRRGAARQRIGQEPEPLPVVLGAEHGQHGPGIGEVRRSFHRQLQR